VSVASTQGEMETIRQDASSIGDSPEEFLLFFAMKQKEEKIKEGNV
jgi:hypothetical protein